MKLVKVVSRYKQMFLDQHGVSPVYEEADIAYYKRTKELNRLLDEAQIIQTFYQHPARRKR